MRSPCLYCENRDQDKDECSKTCKELEEYRQKLECCQIPHCSSICCYEECAQVLMQSIQHYLQQSYSVVLDNLVKLGSIFYMNTEVTENDINREII